MATQVDNAAPKVATVDQIKSAILQLCHEDFLRISEWFCELDNQRWDEEFEKDVAEGRLLTDEWKAELDRRCKDSDENPNDFVTWEDIEAYVRRKR